jgi:hypothetical protein
MDLHASQSLDRGHGGADHLGRRERREEDREGFVVPQRAAGSVGHAEGECQQQHAHDEKEAAVSAHSTIL